MDPVQLQINVITENTSAIDDLNTQLNSLNENIDNMAQHTQDAGQSADDFGNKLSDLALNTMSYVLAFAIDNIISKLIDLGQQFVQMGIQSVGSIENVAIAAQSVFGNSTSGILQWISDFSDETILSQEALDHLAIKMSALKLPTTDLEQLLGNVGNIASGVGTSAQEMNAILGETENIFSIAGQTGEVPILYLRRLGREITTLYPELSKVTGIPVADFKSGTKNLSVSVADFITTMNNLGEGIYNGKAQDQGNTLLGFLDRLNKEFTQTIDSILGESQGGILKKGSILDQLQQGLTWLIAFIDSHESSIVKFFQTLITDFTTEVGPSFEQAFDWIITHPKDIESFFVTLTTDIMELTAALVDVLIPAMTGFLNFLDQNKDTLTLVGNVLRSGADVINLVHGGKTGQQAKTDLEKVGQSDANILSGIKLDDLLPPLIAAKVAANVIAYNQSAQNVNNSRQTNITMHNNISNQVDMSSAAREVGWRVSGR